MKQVLIKDGTVVVADIPAPHVGDRNVLVRVEHSCISSGTEMAGVHASGLPLYRRALRQPENVRRVFEMVRDQGFKRTIDRVQGKLSAGAPTGYSAAGTVVAVGRDVIGFSIGDRVACSGAGVANHAEFIDVPVNLAAHLPSSIGTQDGCTVTLGAIALQGIRRANPTLGETIVVVGLGILGQLTIQMLKANGCKVIGVDVDRERVDLARRFGVDAGVDATSENYRDVVSNLTDGVGADAVIITAASSSNSIISEAMNACRRKARVVLVGDVGLNMNRADLFKKELDFFISTSYGPGRYDPYYEEGGHDYPIGYVRWTENRNMQAYLELLASGRVRLAEMSSAIFEVKDAAKAYSSLTQEGERPLFVMLSYPKRDTTDCVRVQVRGPRKESGKIGVGIIGASNFVQGMHLPNMVRLRDVFGIQAIMSRTGANAKAIATQYSAEYCTTQVQDLLEDPKVEVVFIGTRHNLHAELALAALRADKHTFVEKPLALSPEELDLFDNFFRETPTPPMLMVGFNRRFAPLMQTIKEELAHRTTPMIVNYTMNAGYLPPDHWVHGTEGGGRNIGEACHIYDLFNYLCEGALEASISASALGARGQRHRRNENFVATIRYDDGSICSLTYTSLGAKSYPKEKMQIFYDGKVITLEDYKTVCICGERIQTKSLRAVDKGQFRELEAFGAALQQGGAWPISLEHQFRATRTSLEVERQIQNL